MTEDRHKIKKETLENESNEEEAETELADSVHAKCEPSMLPA